MVLSFFLFIGLCFGDHSFIALPGRIPLSVTKLHDLVDGVCGFVVTTTAVAVFEGLYNVTSVHDMDSLLLSPSATATCAAVFADPIDPASVFGEKKWGGRGGFVL